MLNLNLETLGRKVTEYQDLPDPWGVGLTFRIYRSDRKEYVDWKEKMALEIQSKISAMQAKAKKQAAALTKGKRRKKGGGVSGQDEVIDQVMEGLDISSLMVDRKQDREAVARYIFEILDGPVENTLENRQALITEPVYRDGLEVKFYPFGLRCKSCGALQDVYWQEGLGLPHPTWRMGACPKCHTEEPGDLEYWPGGGGNVPDVIYSWICETAEEVAEGASEEEAQAAHALGETPAGSSELGSPSQPTTAEPSTRDSNSGSASANAATTAATTGPPAPSGSPA